MKKTQWRLDMFLQPILMKLSINDEKIKIQVLQ